MIISPIKVSEKLVRRIKKNANEARCFSRDG
jgi:hypothetical protein